MRATPAVQRCKNQPKRASYRRDRETSDAGRVPVRERGLAAGPLVRNVRVPDLEAACRVADGEGRQAHQAGARDARFESSAPLGRRQLLVAADLRGRPAAPTDYPGRGRGVSRPRTIQVLAAASAATRPRTIQVPGRGDNRPWTIQVLAAASPRPVHGLSRSTTVHGLSRSWPRRRRDPSTDYPGPWPRRQPPTDYPGPGRGVAATRPRTIQVFWPRRRRGSERCLRRARRLQGRVARFRSADFT